MSNFLNMQCPNCGREDRIDILATVWVRVMEGGTDADASRSGGCEFEPTALSNAAAATVARSPTSKPGNSPSCRSTRRCPAGGLLLTHAPRPCGRPGSLRLSPTHAAVPHIAESSGAPLLPGWRFTHDGDRHLAQHPSNLGPIDAMTVALVLRLVTATRSSSPPAR